MKVHIRRSGWPVTNGKSHCTRNVSERDLLIASREKRYVKRYVALKILVAEASGQASEVRILRYIAGAAPAEAQRHVTQLLGEFEHRGPNGTHRCLVFEPMGPSVNTMVEELPQFKPRRREMKVRYPPDMAKSILKQSLQALAFLHSNGVAHGDFQPGNMLFTLQDLDSVPENELRQEEDVQTRSISPPVQRLDGKGDGWAPRYLCIAQPLAPFTCYDRGFKIKLSDMGGGKYFYCGLSMRTHVLIALANLHSVLFGWPTAKTGSSARITLARIDTHRGRW